MQQRKIDETLQAMAEEHQKAFAVQFEYRRNQRRALVESTIDQLRRLLPPTPMAREAPKAVTPSPEVCWPMLDVLSGSIVNVPPQQRPAVSKEELMSRLAAMYGTCGADTASERRRHDEAPEVVRTSTPPVARKQEVIETLRKLYSL